MLRELNKKLQSVFEDIVVKARAGYWLHEFLYTTTSGISRYRIPARAVVGGLEKVEIALASTGPFFKLDEVPASVAQDYRSSTAGTPYCFTVQGDQVDVIPTPNAGSFLRLTYYIRPSQLMTSQSSTQGGDSVIRGQVTLVNTVTRAVTVNTPPFDQSLTVPAVLNSGNQTIDIIHSDGWHELSLVGATQTLAGNIFTVGGTDSMGDIQVGDFVRVADQTDWPCLPDDFHQCLVDATAVKILLQQNLQDKADALAANNGNDILRFKGLLEPRVKAEPKTIPVFRRSRGPNTTPWRAY